MNAKNLDATLNGAACLFIADAILFNQGVISAIICIFVLFISIPRALFNRDHALRELRLKKSAIWLIAVIGVFVFNWASNEMARSRANDVIAAVEAYQQQHGGYPKQLDDLIPSFLPSVPRAKYVLATGEFRYLYSVANPTISYVGAPPFGRHIYRFRAKEWGYLD